MSDRTRGVALVTGASRGIGKATAVMLAEAGYDVAVSARTIHEGEGRSDTDGVALPGSLDTTLAAIEATGAAGLAVRMDVLERESLLEAVDAVLARFGRIDVLVNNAIYQGHGTMVEFADLHEDDLHKIFEGNVYAQLALIRAVLPQMVDRNSGTIVNMISATAYQDPPARIGKGGWGMGYAMSKAAFARVAPMLHRELEDFDIRVFSVDPGFVVTEKTEATGRAKDYAAHFVPATPPVIGAAIRWLVTDRGADSLRGQIVMAQRECKRRGLLPGWPS